jgi:type I restriction enzyme R subunit
MADRSTYQHHVRHETQSMTAADHAALASANFGYLAEVDPVLARYGALAEHYFALEPRDCVSKLRQMAELMAQLAAARVGIEVLQGDQFIDVLRMLQQRDALPREAADLFHFIRKNGNIAIHDHDKDVSHGTALHFLKLGRALAIWFFRFLTGSPTFSPGPFVPPADPQHADQALKGELEDLRATLAANQAALDAANRRAAEQAERYASLRESLSEIAEERELYAALAEEMESRLVQETGRLEASLAAARQEAAEQTTAEIEARIALARQSGDDLDLDEADTRRLIDEQLRDAGWEADTGSLRYEKGVRPQKGGNLAIAEWPAASGPADYVLFCGHEALAIVEAKRKAKDVPGALQQAKRYSHGLLLEGDAKACGGPWGDHRVPFLFATNGRPYLKQLATKSGVWYLDARLATNHPRPLVGWYSPQDLRKELEKDVEGAAEALRSEPTDYLPLRGYQHDAISAIEEALAAGRREVLVAMATGTGKTRTCIGLIYRLIKSGRFRRVLFLVDRTALGEQASNAFKDVRLEQLQSFTDIYDVKELADLEPEPDTRLHLATVQGMIKRIVYPGDDDGVPPVGRYDCLVVDECHRGYNLDREMSDIDLALRDERDYLSKYRRVIEHFDAVKIGLTATPALHTVEIFGEPVYSYSYRQAVVDGFLVDHDPPVRISTKLAEEGIHWAVGEEVPLYDPVSSQMALFRTPDELDFEIDQFNKQVVTENFNRVVCGELARHIDPDLPGKTLVFCATDAHADMVVHLLKEALEAQYGAVDDDAVVKITGAADRPLQLIRRYKNEKLPSIAVTVDLLTTGIDVPPIENLVFLRRVRSRILYEQMLGRATRLCPEIGKGSFRIFDAVDLYAILEDVTTMKPVVADPQTTFALLSELMQKAMDDRQRKDVFERFLVKLQRKKPVLEAHHPEEVYHQSGGTTERLIASLRAMGPDKAAQWLSEHPSLVNFLDAARPPAGKLVVSEHEDEVRKVEHGYGDYARPQDYLDAFAAFVKDNLNEIPALLVVTQRPRDLTRAQLRELKLALDEQGFTEPYLREAWREAKNQDIAATIIGFIRNQALGSPLIPYRDRVQSALQRILDRGHWTAPQRKWLERIGQQLVTETIVDRDALDQGEFKRQGGFARLNKVFDGKLEQVLGDLAGAVWEESA